MAIKAIKFFILLCILLKHTHFLIVHIKNSLRLRNGFFVSEMGFLRLFYANNLSFANVDFYSTYYIVK